MTLEYSGEYICTAKNLGGEMSDVINVDVFGKNICVSIHLSVMFNVVLKVLSTYYMINVDVHSPMILLYCNIKSFCFYMTSVINCCPFQFL